MSTPAIRVFLVRPSSDPRSIAASWNSYDCEPAATSVDKYNSHVIYDEGCAFAVVEPAPGTDSGVMVILDALRCAGTNSIEPGRGNLVYEAIESLVLNAYLLGLKHGRDGIPKARRKKANK